jgi:hypothetical protein
MPHRWNHFFHRLLSNPTFEVAVVLTIVALSVWALMDSEAIYRTPHVPLITVR